MSDFQSAVDAIMLMTGADRPRAEAVARANGLAPRELTPAELAAAERDARIREKEEQDAVTKYFRERGFTVRSTSQSRPSKQAIGFPDLFVTHKTLPIAFFFETKRQVGGVVSDAQLDFREDCWRTGGRWYTGDRYAAAAVYEEVMAELEAYTANVDRIMRDRAEEHRLAAAFNLFVDSDR